MSKRCELRVLLCLLGLAAGGPGHAQEAPAPAPPAAAEQPAPTLQPQSQPVAEVPDTRAGEFSITLFGWLTQKAPKMRTGEIAAEGVVSNLDFTGKPQPLQGINVSLPAGRHHFVHISYFRTRGNGNQTLRQSFGISDAGFSRGDYLSTSYKLQNAKVSFDFLSWPYPVNNASFRIKTYWELQYTTFHTTYDAPYKPMEDEEGNSITTYTSSTNWFVYPSFGIGVEKYFGNSVRLAAKGGGFGIPNFSAVCDGEASIGVRSKQVEFLAGYRGFWVRTSPRQEFYLRQLVQGPFVGLRWYGGK